VTTTKEWVQAIADTWAAEKPRPIFASKCPDADIDMAYSVQVSFDKLRLAHDAIAGFKGALTGKAAQEAMKMPEPASGVLFENMRFESDKPVLLEKFIRPVIETEIGFCIGREISSKIEPGELDEYIAYNLPMIEIADIGFDDPGAMTALDFVATGAAAAGFIAGDKSPSLNVNQVEVVLTCDGELLHKGRGSDAMGDQTRAATWLINQIVSLGYRLKPGHLLMTGSLGRIRMVTEPGSYVADYGDFGKVEFDITL